MKTNNERQNIDIESRHIHYTYIPRNSKHNKSHDRKRTAAQFEIVGMVWASRNGCIRKVLYVKETKNVYFLYCIDLGICCVYVCVAHFNLNLSKRTHHGRRITRCVVYFGFFPRFSFLWFALLSITAFISY